MADSEALPRAALIAALALAVGAIGAVLAVAALHHPRPQPVVVAAMPAPGAQDQTCRALMAALPERLGDYQRAALAAPAPAGTAAWRTGGGGEPVVLRCGLDRPAGFVVGSPTLVVGSVQWFDEADRADRAASSTWYTVDRPVYVVLTLPAGSGPTPIQQLSEVIEQTVAAVPIDPAPPR